MNANRFQKFVLAGVVAFIAASRLCAAPLTWFPGPTMDYPGSAAATVAMPGLDNVVIAGTTAYPEGLIATNIYWTPLGQPFYGGNIAPGAVAGGGAIIVYGGNNGVSSVSTVINYSPSDGSSTLASMSVPRSYLGYAPDASGNAYAIGGLDDSGNPLASAEVYRQDNGAWSAIASLPAARYNFPAVFNHTNYIYVFGGRTNTTSGTETATVLRYFVSANTWTALAPMPVAVAGSAAAFGADGNIYVVGGITGGVTTNVVQVYNPTANSWKISTPLPEGLSGSVMGVDSLGRLIVMGGSDTNGYDVGDVWRSQQLNAPDIPPTLTQFPTNVSATYQKLYTSIISATGNPQPTYSLVSGPAGLTVDYFSGQITWIPQGLNQIGPIPVTIQAANFSGSTNWTFNITVPNPRPATPTNIYVVSETEYSVTLAWSPADPVAGAVTYTVAIPHPYHSPRGSGGGVNYQVIASNLTSTNVTISGLTPNTSYGYDIKATGPGGASGYSGIGVTTLGPQPPANLRVTGITSTTITLAWDPSPGPVPIVRYGILGWVGGLFPTIGYGTNYTGTTATITGLTPGTYEEWTVAGFDADGNVSGYAPGIYAVNPVPKPAALAAVAAPPVTGGFQFTVQASAVQTTLVQATTNMGDPTSWVTIATNPPGNAFIFTDTNSSQFPTRYYRVISP